MGILIPSIDQPENNARLIGTGGSRQDWKQVAGIFGGKEWRRHFQARGSTPYVKYVLAGDAFRFQFQEQVVQPNMSMLKQLGFTHVVLDNGDEVWSWRVD